MYAAGRYLKDVRFCTPFETLILETLSLHISLCILARFDLCLYGRNYLKEICKGPVYPCHVVSRERRELEVVRRLHGCGVVGLQAQDERLADLGDLYTESGQTLQGSFSAVSKPDFASKYS